MRQSTGTALALLAGLLLASFPVRAESAKPESTKPESVRAALEDFGFLGRWAPDCRRPAAPDNSWRDVTLTPGNGVSFIESLGEQYGANTYDVLQATRKAPGTIVLRIELNGTIQQDLTMVLKDGKIRTMTNRPLANGMSKDKPVVKDGIVVLNGRETPWLTRCGE